MRNASNALLFYELAYKPFAFRFHGMQQHFFARETPMLRSIAAICGIAPAQRYTYRNAAAIGLKFLTRFRRTHEQYDASETIGIATRRSSV